jgi:hypothetical protein
LEILSKQAEEVEREEKRSRVTEDFQQRKSWLVFGLVSFHQISYVFFDFNYPGMKKLVNNFANLLPFRL